jgi:proline dehydrogenase
VPPHYIKRFDRWSRCVPHVSKGGAAQRSRRNAAIYAVFARHRCFRSLKGGFLTTLTAPLNGFMRAALLGAADSRALRRFMHRHGMTLGARRFVAGETLDELISAVRALNGRGFTAAAGLLGEGVRSAQEADAAARDYERLLERIAREDLRANAALKLTHLGLAIDPALARTNLAAVVERAARLGNFVRVDMEQSAYTDATLSIYRALRAAGRANVGVVLQSYLYRSHDDLQALLPLQPNVRLVKGAYLEPAAIAYPRKLDVDRALVRLIETSLLGGGFTAIATHDRAVIEHAIAIVERHAVPRERFEFQMLYGVREALQAELIARGFAVRLAIPFGSHWYPYLMRRLAERPANVFFFVGSLWRK